MALLVHLGARRTAVDRHIEELLGADDAYEAADVAKGLHEDLALLLHAEASRVVVRTVVDDAVHVQVEVVELRDLLRGDVLIDQRVALREPAIETRDAHGLDRATSLETSAALAAPHRLISSRFSMIHPKERKKPLIYLQRLLKRGTSHLRGPPAPPPP